MGAAETDVDTAKLAEDLRSVSDAVHKLEPEVILTNLATGEGVSATVAIDQQRASQLVFDIARVGDENGIKFPSEFGLLLKQILYFDRYVRLLAPDVEVVSEERVSFMNSAMLLSGKVSNPDHERF
jgi:predicted unusual protein kinase regulating ubiquinone biosynthesis (AarF/ABC1/UbiB family)